MSVKSTVFVLLFLAYVLFSLCVYTFGTENASVPADASATVLRGKLLFQEKNCISCHQIFGLGGYLGPELTNCISQKDKGKAYAEAILTTGIGRMPDFNLKKDEVQALVAYLEYVDHSSKTGQSSESIR